MISLLAQHRRYSDLVLEMGADVLHPLGTGSQEIVRGLHAAGTWTHGLAGISPSIEDTSTKVSGTGIWDDVDAYPAPTAGSILLWVYLSSLADYDFVRWERPGVGVSLGLELRSAAPSFYSHSGSSANTFTGPTLSVGQWHCLIATYATPKTLFCDGTLTVGIDHDVYAPRANRKYFRGAGQQYGPHAVWSRQLSLDEQHCLHLAGLNGGGR